MIVVSMWLVVCAAYASSQIFVVGTLEKVTVYALLVVIVVTKVFCEINGVSDIHEMRRVTGLYLP